jgi:hypothetical protein
MTTKAKYQIRTYFNNIKYNRNLGKSLSEELLHEFMYLISALERQYGFCFTGF